MRVRILGWTAALLAPALYPQVTPETQSGPFWRHIVRFATIGNCTLTVNGQPFAINTIITDRNTTIRFHEDCSFGGATQAFDGTITPNVPSDMPVATTDPPNFYFQLPPGALQTSVQLNTTMTPGATRTPGSTFDYTVHADYGITTNGPCVSKDDTKKAQPKGAIQSTVTLTCDNQLVTKQGSSQPNGFADGSDTAQIELRFTLKGSENWAPQPGGSITPAGSLELDIVSEYQMAPAKMQFSPNPFQLSGPLGQANSATGSIDVKNIGGGLLDFTLASPMILLLSQPGSSGSGTASATASPARMTGVMPGQSTQVTVNVDSTNVTKDGTFTGTLVFRSDHASNTSSFGRAGALPITLVTGVAPTSDAVQLSNVSPNAATVTPDSDQSFSAHVTYTLGSTDKGSVQLELSDGGPKPLAVSPATSISARGSGSADLVIPTFHLSTAASQVTLRAALRDSGGALLKDDTRTYSFGSAPTIDITSAVPAAGATLFFGPMSRISAQVSYTFSGDSPRVELRLELTGPGNLLLTSPVLTVVPTGKPQQSLLTIADLNIDRDPLTLEAVLRDPVSGNEFRSKPVKYSADNQPEFQFNIYRNDAVKKSFGGVDCESVAHSYYFCGADYRGGANGGPAIAGAGVHVEWAYPTLGTDDVNVELTLQQYIFGGGVQILPLVKEAAGPAFHSAEILSLYPGERVYRWVFQAKVITQSGQELMKNLTFEVEGVWIDPADLPGQTPVQIPGAALPDNFCVNAYYHTVSGAYTRLDATAYYGVFRARDPKATADLNPSSVPLDASALQAVQLCHFLDKLALQQTGKAVLELMFNSGTLSAGSRPSSSKLFTVVAGAPLPAGPGQVVTPPVTLNVTSGLSARPTTTMTPLFQSITSIADTSASATTQSVTTKAVALHDAAAERAAGTAVRPQDVLAINSTVHFDPAIAEDGSFTANLTFQYDPQDFPKDPSFTEAAMQLVSFDPATGAMRAYPTSVDTVNQTATADIAGLAPYYSLAAVGPFAGATISEPVAATSFGVGLSFVNLGPDPAQVTSSGYLRTGDSAGNSAIFSLAPGAQISSANVDALSSLLAQGAWLQTRSDKAGVRGIALLSRSDAIDALPLPAATSATFILTGLEADGAVSTEILISNPANNTASVSVALYDPSGALVGTGNRSVPANGTLDESLASLFPSAPMPFRGYAVVQSTQRVVAARVWLGGAALAAVNGQLPGALGGGARRYVVPFVAGGGTVSRVNLVNAGTSDLTITLTAKAQNGATIGQPVSVTVAAGAQYWGDIGSVFPVPSGAITPGSLVIDSSSGVAGDISFGEAGYRLWSSLALSEPATSLVIPLVSNQTDKPMAVAVANSGTAVANATLHVLGADGVETGSAKLTIPAGGLTYDLLTVRAPSSAGQTGGYLRLDSDQPIIAVGLIGTLTQLNDIAAIPAAPATGSVTGPTTQPAISVPASLDFGSVTVGTSQNKTISISNNGNAALTVTGMTVAAPFRLVSPAAPFSVAAGASSAVTVSFAPLSAGPQSASLAIASNDPAKPSVSVSLSGTGAAPSGGGSVQVSPTSLDFGSVNTGQTSQPMTITLTNGSAAPASVTLSTNAPFTVSAASLTLAANGGVGTAAVNFMPTVATASSGTLSVTISGQSTPVASVSLTGTGVTPTSGNPAFIRTLAYNEITRFTKEVRFSNGGMPVLSASGNRVVYANAPGDETDARYNHISVVNADGAGQREVDVYKQNCYCGAEVDISADGNTVVSTDGVELRAATAAGSAGKRLITNREIPYMRIAPRGDKVYFIHRRGDATTTDPTTERGLYVINIDGSGLKQVAGPKAVSALLGITPDKVFPFGTNGWSLDVSADGTKLAFGVAAPGGERIFTVGADGSGLKLALGPADFVNHVALSGDGTKLAYDVIPPPCCSTPDELGIVNADGSNRQKLSAKPPDIGSANRIEMSSDGKQLLYGGSSYLYATDGTGVVQLSARGGYFSSDKAPLVTDGFGQSTMNSAATRFLYIVRDDAGIPQLATMDLNPSALGDAPSITTATLSQQSIALNGAGQSLISAMISTSNTISRVSAAVLSAGTPDQNVNAPVMQDDGTGTNNFTGQVSANCCATLGPHTVRVKAEVRDSGNRRHATAIEIGGLTVVSSAP